MAVSRKPGFSAADSGPRRQRRAAETRLRLFRCALDLFARRGFFNVTVEDITEAADVGKGTFFNYFESKDHVLGVMAEIQAARVLEAAPEVEAGKRSIREVLHYLALKLSEEPGKTPQLARALISSFLTNEVVRNLIDARIEGIRKLFAAYIGQGQKRGEIDWRLDKDAVAVQFQQAVMGTILLWSLHGSPPLATRIDESFQHFWRAVAAPAPETSPRPRRGSSGGRTR